MQEKFTPLSFKPNDIVLTDYKIIKEIARGGMESVIYVAQDLKIKGDDYVSSKNKYVVVKVINRNDKIDDSDWTKFIHEYVTSTRVSGLKNIIKTYEQQICNDENSIIIVMEYVNGPSLKKYIDQCGILPIHEAIYFTRMICEAINELHCMKDKIIHRDLKPENILLSKDLIELKLIDFGISSVKSRISNKNTKNLLTNEDAIFGTYPYLCPDILQITKKSTEYEKSKIISEQLDIFPVGVMLYEMVSGEKPFAASDYENKDVISLPLYYDVPPISEFNSTIPKIIDNIIFKCIASKPDDIKYRYKNIQELINDLDSVETMKNVTTLPLIKPLNKRVLQYKKIFDIEKQKHKRKYFEEWWFIWIMFGGGIAITVIMIILIIIL